ncbi:MAG: hypothetical protein COA42_00680 [Alteromonadaceae bacterium]|nr:MAG: hypothetical protein COA42_00680 [Alteromonadaceae bacterium]
MPAWSIEDIGYCANVHAGVTPDSIEQNLVKITAEVRRERGLNSMAAGLWLCEQAAQSYVDDDARLDRLVACLEEQQLYTLTFNGFPQGDFHQAVVKTRVYEPTWADPSRLQYSCDLATILSRCLPERHDVGTISTLPLAYRLSWRADQHVIACENLCRFAMFAERLEANTGKCIRLCLEMEPGCVLERSDQLLVLFAQDLPIAAKSVAVSEFTMRRYLGICYDICHQAVMQEDITQSVKSIHQANILIGKVQVSSAMYAPNPADVQVQDALQGFAEPKYLHQVTTRSADGALVFCDDLSDALGELQLSKNAPWWIHYHLPIQASELSFNGLTTTQKQILTFFDAIKILDYSPHFEVETYTWDVLPASERLAGDAGLIQGLTGELQWLERQLKLQQMLV